MIAEAHARILKYVGIPKAMEFVHNVYTSTATSIVPLITTDENAARAILQDYQDKDFSFADALTFAVMERFNVTWAFSFDRHYKQYGQFTVIDSQDYL